MIFRAAHSIGLLGCIRESAKTNAAASGVRSSRLTQAAFFLALVWSVGSALAGSLAPFSEEADARGVSYFAIERASLERFGYGLAFVDLDGDSDPDIVVTGAANDLAGIYENDGSGFFADRSAGNGIPALLGRSGVVALDYDADGDQDLYFTQIDQANVLVRNDGNFQFTDVSVAAGVDGLSRGTGATVGDYDGDGWLDIHVPNYNLPDFLYHNLGTGAFEEVAVAAGVADPWRGWQSVFFDMDWDGDLDLYVSNDKKVALETSMHNRLYENVGGVFNDISAASGTDVNIYSMGLAIGDFDGSGLQDIYCTNLADEANALLMNQSGTSFIMDSSPSGTDSFRTGWGAVFFDYDNDGNQDLYVCDMVGPPVGALANNRLYSHTGSWPCVDIAPSLSVDDAADSFAVAVGDIDNDGDLDMLVQSNNERIRLFVNQEGQTRQWIKFDVVGQGANLLAVGAHVAVRTGSTWQHRQIIAGGNTFKSQNELAVSVGLNIANTADEVVATWPGGSTRSILPMPANNRWTLYPPEKLGDSEQDGDLDLVDHAAFVGCLTGHSPGTTQAGCEMMDFDGDHDNDLADFGALLVAMSN